MLPVPHSKLLMMFISALSPGSRTRVIDSDMSTGSDSVATGSDSGATGSDRSDYSGSVCSDDHDEETTSEPRLAREGSRKLIKPDFSALSQLLNFDEVMNRNQYSTYFRWAIAYFGPHPGTRFFKGF